jgi:hypothetical protein
MPPTSAKTRRPMTTTLLVISLLCFGLAACGSSSSGSASGSSSTAAPTTSSTTAPATTATTATTPAATPTTPNITTSRQLEQVYQCMIANGIKLPSLKGLSKISPALAKSQRYITTLEQCKRDVLG